MMVANTSRTALRSAVAARPLARSLHSSRVVRAGSASSSAADEEYPAEGFGAPIWRYTIGGLIVGVGLYRLSAVYAEPNPSAASSTGKHLPSEDTEVEQPWLTRYIAYWTTPSSVWKHNSTKHLDLVREQAETRLLFQDAERPPMHRFVFPQVFEQASPHNIAPGTQIDLSDLKVKRASE